LFAVAVCGTAPAQPVAHAVALAGWRPLRLCCVPRTCLAAAAPPHLPAPACPTELNVVVSYDSMLNRLAWPEEPRAPWLQHACGLRRSSVPQLCRPVGACRQLLTHWQPHEGCRGAAAAAACHPAPLTALASRTHLIKLPPHSPPPLPARVRGLLGLPTPCIHPEQPLLLTRQWQRPVRPVRACRTGFLAAAGCWSSHQLTHNCGGRRARVSIHVWAVAPFCSPSKGRLGLTWHLWCDQTSTAH
jgi:hypothetical protein